MLNGTGRETFDAIKMMQSIQKKLYAPATVRKYPKGRLGQSLQQIARRDQSRRRPGGCFHRLGGWDTHVNEVGVSHMRVNWRICCGFWRCAGAFSLDMGDRMADITVVTMSEFGRTAKENGDRGTDHGHANVMFVMGGNVRGGKIYGEWPGLEPEQLYEGRDLNVTTDFRDCAG